MLSITQFMLPIQRTQEPAHGGKRTYPYNTTTGRMQHLGSTLAPVDREQMRPGATALGPIPGTGYNPTHQHLQGADTLAAPRDQHLMEVAAQRREDMNRTKDEVTRVQALEAQLLRDYPHGVPVGAVLGHIIFECGISGERMVGTEMLVLAKCGRTCATWLNM